MEFGVKIRMKKTERSKNLGDKVQSSKSRIKLKTYTKRITIAFIAVATYLTYVALGIWFYGYVDQASQADAAIVLGAAAWHIEPSPVFKERIRHGIWLFENGYVDYIIFTGGKGDGSDYSEAYVAKRYAIESGIPPEAILIEEQSRTTQENLYYATQLAEENDIDTAIIVSDPLHMKRAMRIARDYNLAAHSSPTPTTKYKTLSTQLPFLKQEVAYYIGYTIISLFN